MTVTVEDTERPETRRSPSRIVVAVVVLAVVAALVWIFGPNGGATGRAASSHRATGSSGSSSVPSLPSGLQQGTASASFAEASRTVSGVPRGFPRTIDGAVEAYTASLGTFVMGMAAMTDAQLRTFVMDFMHSDLDFAPLAARKRQLVGMSRSGTIEGARAGDRLVSVCPAALGAYKALRRTPDDVTVSYWGPCVYGTGSSQDRDRLHVVWQSTTATMHWSDGDWRLPATAKPRPPASARPADLDRPDTRFAERGRLLGPGWSLFDGASQAWPTSLLGPRP